MKVVILAGGAGTRLAEETATKPKPMVDIGGRPILWHLLNYYACFGFTEFIIALGYRGDSIKRYFADACRLEGNIVVDFGAQTVTSVDEPPRPQSPWRVELVETGADTQTGGRIKRLAPYLRGEGTFMLTWGDGLADIDLHSLLRFHRSHGRLATVTAVHPPARFGEIQLDGDRVTSFREKPEQVDVWVNGAFFVLEHDIFDYIEADATQWEHEPMMALARDDQLMAYKHEGFWQCMDTVSDRARLEKLWVECRAPWKAWD